MNIQRLWIARRQLAEEFASKENTTIETDETSKYGMKYGAFAIRDGHERSYLVGLRDMANKSCKDTLDTFREILWDLDHLCQQFTPDDEQQDPRERKQSQVSANILFFRLEILCQTEQPLKQNSMSC